MPTRYASTPMRAAFLPLLLLLLGAAPRAGAQPTITEATYRARLERTNVVTVFDAQNPDVLHPITAMRGGGHVFNLAETPFTAIDTARYTPFTCGPAIPGCDLPAFAGANVRLRREGGSAEETSYAYYDVQPTGVLVLGTAARYDFDDERPGEETLVGLFEPAAREIPFPLNTSRAWTDRYAMTITEPGLDPLMATGFETRSDVVAWGTLVTPGGSAPALMVREAQRTSTSFGGNTIVDTLVTYTFVTEAHVQAAITVDPDTDTIIDATYTTYAGTTTAAERPSAGGPGLTLGAPAPNPARGPVRLGYALDAPRAVTLTVHDALGREVARLIDALQGPGAHEVTWDATGQPAGVYLVRLHDGAARQSRTLTLVR